MAWKIDFTDFAVKQFKKMNKSIAKELIQYLKDKVLTKPHPTDLGDPLCGNKSGFWRYRVGDYRIVCEIKEKDLVILIINAAHRKHVYD